MRLSRRAERQYRQPSALSRAGPQRDRRRLTTARPSSMPCARRSPTAATRATRPMATARPGPRLPTSCRTVPPTIDKHLSYADGLLTSHSRRRSPQHRIAALGLRLSPRSPSAMSSSAICAAMSVFVTMVHRDRYGYPASAQACRRCGLTFLNPVMTGEAYGEFYHARLPAARQRLSRPTDRCRQHPG